MRIIVRCSMALVALAAAALSYQSLAHLGWLCGYGGLSWLYPLVVDAGAAASCAAWLHTRGRQPLVMTWCLLAVSVVLNGTTHYLESTHTPPSWLLVVAVAAVPPTVLGLCVHLAVGMGQPGQGPRSGLPGLTALEEDKSGDTQAICGETDKDRPGRISMRGGPAGSTAQGAVAEGAGQSSPEDGLALDLGVERNRPGRLDHWQVVPTGSTAPTALGVADSSTEATGLGTRSDVGDPVAELIESGIGRRRLAAELDISEHAARVLLAERRNGAEVPR